MGLHFISFGYCCITLENWYYQDFSEPISTEDISELSADGGKVRLRAPQGEKSEWKDYKAIVSEAGMMASFNQNDIIVNWANKQPLAKPVTWRW
jgi:hypothetical protein